MKEEISMNSEGGGGFGAEPSVDYEIKGTGAFESPYDPRTVPYFPDTGGLPPTAITLVKGGTPYLPEDLLDQHKVGICTAISVIQNRNKVNGKRYSSDFQYLLQKKYIDGNWDEGSSALSALKVGKNFGFLPASLWMHTSENDRGLPYDQYIAKLKAVSDKEILRLLTLCIDKLLGYKRVIDTGNPQVIAQGILDSAGGLIVRYNSGNSWYTDVNGNFSWDAAKINPIRPPNPITSGHLIVANMFDFTNGLLWNHPNTWGKVWCKLGQCNIDYNSYRMTEAWILEKAPVVIQQMSRLEKGSKGDSVKQLQMLLNAKINAGLIIDGIFGNKTDKAVRSFQSGSGLVVDGIVGSKTWGRLFI